MKEIFKLLRIHQWAKNLLLFAPVFFSGHLSDPELLKYALIGFFLFGILASSIYIFNDYKDISNDRLHPKKKFRPLASGSISIPTGLGIASILFLTALVSAWLINESFFFILLTYAIINILYSLGMKNFSLLDIFIVSSGFVLRVLAGGVFTLTPISHWVFIMTF